MIEYEEADSEYYLGLGTDELRKLTVSGDEHACAYYIVRLAENGTLKEDDVKFLEQAVKNLNYDCALIAYKFVYGLKGGLYEDEEMFALCAAVLEQYGFKDAHTDVKKLFKKNQKLVNETDRAVYMRTFTNYLERLLPSGCDGLFINIEKADKKDAPVDPKHAYKLGIYAASEAGGIFNQQDIYTLYFRDKYVDRSLIRLSERLNDYLEKSYTSYLIRSYRISIAGKIQHKTGVYGGTIDSGKIQKKLDDGIEIAISDERLSTSGCPSCGGLLDGNGVCKACGKKAKTKEDKTDKIIIHRAKDMEALYCTQCGGAVDLDKDNKTAYCPFCGTTFIVNGNALSGSVLGIDFNGLRADMPEDATLPDVKFVRAKICKGISTILPDSFDIMLDEYRRIKYPNNPPDFIYTTPDTRVNLCLSFRGELSNDDVYLLGSRTAATIRNIRKDARMGDVRELCVNGKNILYFDFLTTALDGSIYNAMFFFSYKGQRAMGSWNCLGKDRWFWSPIFEHAVKTIDF